MTDIPDHLPFSVILQAAQVEFEQAWAKLTPLERQRLACKMAQQILQLEQTIRYWEKICEQKQESIRLMAKLAGQEMNRQCSRSCIYEQGTHDE